MTQTSDSFGCSQNGAALLLFMLLVIVATATVLVSTTGRDALAVQQQLDTREKLDVARQSLLDYALLRADQGDGRDFTLPCPDIDDSGGFADGEAHDTACGPTGVTVAGRLPWRSLELPALQDASASCLWYVVSGSWKDAALQTAAMINPDSNGALQLYNTETGGLVEGAQPEERPVAMVFAPMRPLTGQSRPASVPGRQCAPGASVSDYLDDDAATGISNAWLSGAADSIELFAASSGSDSQHNDRVATISRADIAAHVASRQDSATELRDLGLAAAACIANYAATNPGGANDLRMPWPTTVSLTDYRSDTNYDDADNGFISGRLADFVDDSNANTGNGIARLLNDCDASAVPAWTAEMAVRWSQWKDHFFYAVAPSHAPNAVLPTACGSCLTVNGSGQYAAVLIFGNERLAGQVRNAPPTDPDTKRTVANYLESINAAAVPGTAADYQSGMPTPTFNDRLFCIDPTLLVAEC